MGYRKGGRLSWTYDCGMVVSMPSSSAPWPEDIAALGDIAENVHHVECGCGAT